MLSFNLALAFFIKFSTHLSFLSAFHFFVSFILVFKSDSILSNAFSKSLLFHNLLSFELIILFKKLISCCHTHQFFRIPNFSVQIFTTKPFGLSILLITCSVLSHSDFSVFGIFEPIRAHSIPAFSVTSDSFHKDFVFSSEFDDLSQVG